MGNMLRIRERGFTAALTLAAALTLGAFATTAPASAVVPAGPSAATVVAPVAPSLSGTVTGSSATGSPLANVAVSAVGAGYGWATTDAAGHFTMADLAPGDYQVTFSDYSPTRNHYVDQEKTVTVGATGDTVLNATLKQGSTIGGTLTQNVAGTVSPAAYVSVDVVSLDGTVASGALTDAQGKYRVGALAAGTYKVTFDFEGSATGLIPEYYNDVHTFAEAKPITIGSAAAVTGINAQLNAMPHVKAVTPTITGTKTVGSTLTAHPGDWGPGVVAMAYQWYGAGVQIDGARAKTYTLSGANAGKTLTVLVTGSKTGYTSRSRASAATTVIAKGALTSATPTITGTATVGSALTANPGTWGPATVRLKYQWYRSDVAIIGATAKTYTVVSADRGFALKVRVVGSKLGYFWVTKYSAPTITIP